jgi:hypothetical protein
LWRGYQRDYQKKARKSKKKGGKALIVFRQNGSSMNFTRLYFMQ